MVLLSGVAHAATATVVVEGVREDAGVVACSAYRGPEGFPDDAQLAAALQVATPVGGRAVCTFVDLPPGPLAVAVFHDRDGDLQLDRNLFGKPTEGYGFSNGATASLFSAPSFDAARVRVDADITLHVSVVY